MKLKIMPLLVGAAISTIAVPLAAQACNKGQTTQAQQTQLEQVSRNTVQQVEAVLSPEQQQQFQAAVAQGQGMGTALADLNLSAEQQTQLQRIMQSAKTQKQQILNSNRS